MKKKAIKHRRGSAEVSLTELLLKIREWYHYLLSKRALILTFSMLGGFLGGVFSLVKKPVYVASISFVLEDKDKIGGFGQYAGLASMFGISMASNDAGSIFQGDNILELYKSQTMIEKTLLTPVFYEGKKELLIDRFIDFNGLRKKWAEEPALKSLHYTDTGKTRSPAFARLQDSIMDKIVEDINTSYLKVAKPDKKLNIISAEVKASDEFFAKNFNEQIVKNVNDFYIQTKTKRSLKNVLLLQRKTDSIRAVMNKPLYSATTVVNGAINVNSSAQAGSGTSPLQRSLFVVDMNQAILAELVKNLEMSKITLEKEIPLIQVIDVPKYPLKKIELATWQGVLGGIFAFGFLTTLFLWFKKIVSDLIDQKESTPI